MSAMEAPVTVRVPAKINLALVVGQADATGYHELATVFHAVSLYDDLEATLDPTGEIRIEVNGRGAHEVPDDERNLAVRAALAVRERAGITDGVRLRLHKRIPVAGGMAGGSADAAAALVACDTLWSAGLSRFDLLDLAAGLGADVAFPLLGGTAVGSGRGERLSPVLARGEYDWVVALAGFGLSTPAVFAELDRMRAGRILAEPRVPDRLMEALRAGQPQAVAGSLVNEMQDAACALAPSLATTLEAGVSAGALAGIVSGSGPSIAFLARSSSHAADVAAALDGLPGVAEVLRVSGPVPGARVLAPALREG